MAEVAFGLFMERGFEATTMQDIADALGVARRTLFRYYPSKNDLVWGEFDRVLDRLRDDLRAVDQDQSLMAVVRQAAVRSNTYPTALLGELHQRIALIQAVPALQAHSMLRYAAWRQVVADYAAERLGCAPDHLVPVMAGHAALAASSAAYSRWVTHRDEDLIVLLDRAYALLEDGFA